MKCYDQEYTYEFTCPKCGCHVPESDGFAWLEFRQWCTGCRTLV